ncbi:MAG: glutamine synthetase type III, partial [Clostridiales bacterium]|nr:glutamine synthetase type III [Clostridiales bacterium]
IEANTMVTMAKTEIAPAIEAYAMEVAKAATAKKALDVSLICNYESELIRKLSALTDKIAVKADELEEAVLALHTAKDIIAQANAIRDTVLVKMNELRIPCDEAETLTAKKYWPYPTYGDLLFSVR